MRWSRRRPATPRSRPCWRECPSQTIRARVWRGNVDRGVVARTISQHEDILAALVARDPELAEAAATIHVATTEAWIKGDRGRWNLADQEAPRVDRLVTFLAPAKSAAIVAASFRRAPDEPSARKTRPCSTRATRVAVRRREPRRHGALLAIATGRGLLRRR